MGIFRGKIRLGVCKAFVMFAAISLVFLFYSSISIAQGDGVSKIDLPTLNERLAANEGKVVVINFWSPF